MTIPVVSCPFDHNEKVDLAVSDAVPNQSTCKKNIRDASFKKNISGFICVEASCNSFPCLHFKKASLISKIFLTFF